MSRATASAGNEFDGSEAKLADYIRAHRHTKAHLVIIRVSASGLNSPHEFWRGMRVRRLCCASGGTCHCHWLLAGRVAWEAPRRPRGRVFMGRQRVSTSRQLGLAIQQSPIRDKPVREIGRLGCECIKQHAFAFASEHEFDYCRAASGCRRNPCRIATRRL